VIVGLGPGLDAGLWLAGLTPLVWVSAAVLVVVIGLIAVEGWFRLNLTSQQGRLLEALEGSIGAHESASRAANASHMNCRGSPVTMRVRQPADNTHTRPGSWRPWLARATAIFDRISQRASSAPGTNRLQSS
jgi:hypothetical protein